jgi:hypothetical protein
MSRVGSHKDRDSAPSAKAMDSARRKLIERLRSQLFGPRNGEDEWVPADDPPHKRYLVGVLFPRETLPDAEEDAGSLIASESEDGPDDSPLAAMLQRAPASAGMTFSVQPGTSVVVTISGAAYGSSPMPGATGRDIPNGFRRSPLPVESLTFSDQNLGDTATTVWDGRAQVRCRWRHSNAARVVTVSIINAATSEADSRVQAAQCLYQIGMDVQCVQGGFAETPAPDVPFDSEEAELRLRYRKKVAWATGHSCSVDWSSPSEGNSPTWIRMDFLPQAEVSPFSPGVRPDRTFDERVLSLQWLANGPPRPALQDALESFVADFQLWTNSQCAVEVESVHISAKSLIVEALRRQATRLEHGIRFLCDVQHPERQKAFALANHAMLEQMRVSAHRAGRAFDPSQSSWRPFQLAFQLLAIPGTTGSDTYDCRDVVDLIWFPTGGGKTEAYLLLSAFVIIWRRLVHGDSGCGTAVISRYTLRLLTNQQFERTAALACALDSMRRRGLIPGTRPIEVGLWIGGGKDSAPNTLKAALFMARQTLEEDPPINRFLLLGCPWCARALLPRSRVESREEYGFIATASEFYLRCPNSDCTFHDRLPVQIVDQALYAQPPAILLGTIDKFARLPWESRAGSFFGLSADRGVETFRAPDLVIQDELHLISGPLGTLAAIYEAGMDVLACRGGAGPKYVAATATIRGATDQARRLYGRQIAVFPASGVDCDDSFYMFRSHDAQASRLYVGSMGLGHTPVTSTIHCMAALLECGAETTSGDDYWTLVVYHNSRRELGKSMTLARDDVPKRISAISPRCVRRNPVHVVELSSNLPGYRIPRVIVEAEQPRDSAGAIDVLACTNMLSVGVDIQRLNMMLVLGQPKTTAEYIQASSRVGRAQEAAGIVLLNCVATKPRDRAHFENFKRYHESIYRWVEPTSVTPQSPEALRRALHAAVVLAVRHLVLPGDSEAGTFSPGDARISQVLNRLRARLTSAVDAADCGDIEQRLAEVIGWWAAAAAHTTPLHYRAELQFKGLLQYPNQHLPNPAKPTLNAMRSVDGDVECFILGAGT